MSNESERQSPVAVLYTPEFKRNLRQLAKKYRQIKTNVQPLLDTLGQGQTLGDQIPAISMKSSKSACGIPIAVKARAAATALFISV